MSDKDKFGSTRRDFLKVAGAGSLLSCGPYIHAQSKPRLRVLATSSNLEESIRLRAQEDLDIEIEYFLGSPAQILQQSINAPDSFDILAESASYTHLLRQADALQDIDANRISHWDEVGPLNKTGHVVEGSSIGAGDAPHKIIFLNPDGSMASEQTDSLCFVPHMSSPVSFTYNADIITPGVPYETESWSWLLDKENRGRTGLYNDPSVAIFDLGLAAQASGLIRFEDIGAMTRDEVDCLMEIALQLKSEGHFAGFWGSRASSVDFMRTGRVAIESTFSSTAYLLRNLGINARVAAPKEGYRGWQGGMFLSARTEGYRKDIAYEYMDWWLSGWAGAQMTRNGYYISTSQLSRPWMSTAEWDYWYAGKPATEDLSGFNNEILIPAGEVRRGGSYQERMSHIAVWNTIMPTFDYTLQRWYELTAV